jgi:hypothetical protein
MRSLQASGCGGFGTSLVGCPLVSVGFVSADFVDRSSPSISWIHLARSASVMCCCAITPSSLKRGHLSRRALQAVRLATSSKLSRFQTEPPRSRPAVTVRSAQGRATYMAGRRVLAESEKDAIREQRRAKEMQKHPGARFFIYVADETDDEGEPLVFVMRTDVWIECRDGSQT